jgi:hypothetical protein
MFVFWLSIRNREREKNHQKLENKYKIKMHIIDFLGIFENLNG